MDPNKNTAPVFSLCMFTITKLGIPSQREGTCGLKPAPAHCFLQSSLCWLSVYTPCLAEPRMHFPCAMLAWLAQEDITLFPELSQGRLFTQPDDPLVQLYL